MDGAWESVSVIRYIAGGAEYHFFACCGAYRIENRELPLEMMADKALVAMECARDSYLKPCVWFDESMWDAIVEEQQLNMDFATAIREKQFEVYFQLHLPRGGRHGHGRGSPDPLEPSAAGPACPRQVCPAV